MVFAINSSQIDKVLGFIEKWANKLEGFSHNINVLKDAVSL